MMGVKFAFFLSSNKTVLKRQCLLGLCCAVYNCITFSAALGSVFAGSQLRLLKSCFVRPANFSWAQNGKTLFMGSIVLVSSSRVADSH